MAGSTSSSDQDEMRAALWNSAVGPANYAGDTGDAGYRAAVLDQYKLYVEMADRISSRRGLTNTFFLTLNTLVFTVFGVLWKDKPPDVSTAVLCLLLAVVLGECAAWWFIVCSYRQLNAAKFKVVGLLEERLPASPYWSAEWKALGEGGDWRAYFPLTHVEQWVPVLFAAVYAIGFVVALTA